MTDNNVEEAVRSRSFRSGMPDWLSLLNPSLIALIVILAIGVVLLPIFKPAWWCWCVTMLDVRNVPEWSYRTWTGVVGSLLGILVLIRFWPPRKEPGKVQEP